MRLAVLMDVLKLFLDDGGVLFVTSVLQKKQEQTNKTKHGIKYQTIKQYIHSFRRMYRSLNGNFNFPHSSSHEHSFSLKRARMMHPKKLLTKNHSFGWTVVLW